MEDQEIEKEIEEERQKILRKSIAWITNNKDAELRDLPSELLEEWIDSDYGEDVPSSSVDSLPMSVFIVALMEKKGNKFQMKEKLFAEHYHLWQTKLNLLSMHNCGMVKIADEPIKLFSFVKSEKIKILEVAEIIYD